MLSLRKYVHAFFPLMPSLSIPQKRAHTPTTSLLFKKMLSLPEYVLILREYPHFVKMYPSPKIKMVLSRCKSETGPVQKQEQEIKISSTNTRRDKQRGGIHFKVQKNILILKKKLI